MGCLPKVLSRQSPNALTCTRTERKSQFAQSIISIGTAKGFVLRIEGGWIRVTHKCSLLSVGSKCIPET